MSEDQANAPKPETLPPEAPVAVANPAEPAAPTVVQPAEGNRSLVGSVAMAGFPKTKYHPVHGRVVVNDPNEEASLSPPTDYFDTPEEADMHRTATEAWTTHAANMRAKLNVHDEAGHEIVRNSVQADESIRSGGAEPL